MTPRPGDATESRAEEPGREEDRPRAEEPAAEGPKAEAAAEPHGDPVMEAAEAAGDAEGDPPDPDADADADADGTEDPLARAELERDQYLALAQRTQADFENFRKRAAKDVAAAGARAKAGMVRELLPAVDNLERALSTAGEGDEGLVHGVRLVHSELTAALERNGVESFEPGGEAFDPNVHEAISTRPDDGAEAGVVLDVVEKGYRLDGTILRPARVVVAA